MNRHFIKIFLSLCIFGLFLYSYIDKQNSLTKLKIELPKIAKEVLLLKEENKRLQYEIDQFENPLHLMQLARCPEYSHLKHPIVKDVLKVKEGLAIVEKKSQEVLMKRAFPTTVGSK